MGVRGLSLRAIRPPDDIVPNANDPALNPPATVGPDQLVNPGDPNGVELLGEAAPAWIPPAIIPSAWSGWPADWWPPPWGNGYIRLTDTAWMCIDYNASILSSMPPYLVNAAPSLPADWLRNPEPTVYTSWDEFAKQAFWDYQSAGETFVLATARYATGWPARFHVVPTNLVNVEMGDVGRVYRIGDENVTRDILHIRYQSTTSDAHGHGPLEAAAARVRAAGALNQYASTIASGGLIPSSILEAPQAMSGEQSQLLRDQWVAQRMANPGLPAVLSGGLKWTPTQLNPTDMALLDLAQYNDARICALLKVPAALVNIDTGESMTYANVVDRYVGHWRGGLRPIAQYVMSALSEWLLPRGTTVELNRDAYVEQEPKARAETYQIMAGIVDADGNPAISVDEIRKAERFDQPAPADLSSGVLK